jgi:hypothetical protein
MGTLSAIMMNLKNQLFQKYGFNKIYLKEVMNSDSILMITLDNNRFGITIGQVSLTKKGWVLDGLSDEVIEYHMNEMKELVG